MTWDDCRIFLSVLEHGSISAAARELRLSHPTVRNRIDALEQALGVVLFTRSAAGLRPTEQALTLHAPASSMKMSSQVFLRMAATSPDTLQGVVRLSVSELMGIEVVPRVLAKLRIAHPDIQIELSLSNAAADLLTREVDIAVRTVEPHQSGLIARKLPPVDLGLFASKDYLSRRGTPQDLDELACHDVIGPDRNQRDLMLAESLGCLKMAIRTDSHPAQLATARAGAGIAVTQVPVGEADARLVRVLPRFVVAKLGVWIVMHEDLRQLPIIRAVFDALVEFIGSQPERR